MNGYSETGLHHYPGSRTPHVKYFFLARPDVVVTIVYIAEPRAVSVLYQWSSEDSAIVCLIRKNNSTPPVDNEDVFPDHSGLGKSRRITRYNSVSQLSLVKHLHFLLCRDSQDFL